MPYVPDSIVDTHVHLELGGEATDALLSAMKRFSIRSVWLFGKKHQHDKLFANASRHEDFARPFPMFDLDSEPPELVDDLRRDGAWGLKFIVPRKNYDDDAYMPVYERMAAHKMAAYFHTGIIGGDREKPAPGVSTARMHPMYLDAIARTFRNLTVIGAHLGNPWFETAIELMRYSANLFFDICGSTLRVKMTPDWMNRILHDRELWRQLLYATDIADTASTWGEGWEGKIPFHLSVHRGFLLGCRVPKEYWAGYFRDNALSIEAKIAPHA